MDDKRNRVVAIPAPGEGKRGESGHIGYLLRQAGGVFRARMDETLSEIGGTTPQFVILTMIANYPGASGADLARLCLLTPQTVSLIVANLKRAGAVASRPHPLHGRVKQLEITHKGLALLARCAPTVAALEQRLEAGLDADEARIVRKWLVAAARI